MASHDEAVRRELEERAGVLCRLRFRQEEIGARLRAYLRWEYERNPPVPFLAEVDAIVARVVARGGSTRHGAPSLE